MTDNCSGSKIIIELLNTLIVEKVGIAVVDVDDDCLETSSTVPECVRPVAGPGTLPG